MIPADACPPVRALAESLAVTYSRFRLVVKENSGFMRLIGALVAVLGNRRFMDGFTTTIGYTVYMPSAVMREAAVGVAVLRHEAVHLEQFRRHPLWFPLSYLLVAPAGWTMRARWEMQAYMETMRAELEETGSIADSTIDHIARRFTGPDYFFMDVRRRHVRRRLEAERARLLGG